MSKSPQTIKKKTTKHHSDNTEPISLLRDAENVGKFVFSDSGEKCSFMWVEMGKHLHQDQSLMLQKKWLPPRS